MFLCIEKRYGRIYLKLVIVVSLESKQWKHFKFSFTYF